MSVKIAYKKLGLFIPVLCIIVVGAFRQRQEAGEPVVTAMTEAENETPAANAGDIQEKPQIALTFDDGPHPRYTVEILDGLARRDVKATFFLLGKNIEGREEIVRRMNEEGHLIGNHSYSHARLISLRDVNACEELLKTNELIYDIIGSYPTYVRPPFGEWKTGLECEEIMIPVLWTVDSYDWKNKNADKIYEEVIKNAGDGDIILMHDWYDTSVKAAMRIVDELEAQGYEFVTIDQLIYE